MLLVAIQVEAGRIQNPPLWSTVAERIDAGAEFEAKAAVGRLGRPPVTVVADALRLANDLRRCDGFTAFGTPWIDADKLSTRMAAVSFSSAGRLRNSRRPYGCRRPPVQVRAEA